MADTALSWLAALRAGWRCVLLLVPPPPGGRDKPWPVPLATGGYWAAERSALLGGRAYSAP
jgi:hypothetical protein